MDRAKRWLAVSNERVSCDVIKRVARLFNFHHVFLVRSCFFIFIFERKNDSREVGIGARIHVPCGVRSTWRGVSLYHPAAHLEVLCALYGAGRETHNGILYHACVSCTFDTVRTATGRSHKKTCMKVVIKNTFRTSQARADEGSDSIALFEIRPNTENRHV